jgi:transcriptional regulator with XRE-family HTH domain
MTDAKRVKRKKGIQLTAEVQKAIGGRLKAIRLDLGLTQRELIDALDVTSSSYLSEMEQGKTKVGFEFLYKFCSHFKVNPSYLLFGEASMFKDQESKPNNNELTFQPFGTEADKIKNMLETMMMSEMTRYAMFEAFSRYKLHNREDIEKEINYYQETHKK